MSRWANFADELRIVRSGLDANDKVIVAGLQKIFVPNTPVKPKIVAMGALPPAAVLASCGKIGKHAHGFLQILHRPPDLRGGVLSIVILVAGLISMPLLPSANTRTWCRLRSSSRRLIQAPIPKSSPKPCRLHWKNRSTASKT